jgi:hypothetical protein
MTKKNWLLLVIALGALSLVFAGCSSDDDTDPGITDPGTDVTATCEGCHVSETMLKATVLPDEEPPESEGEG